MIPRDPTPEAKPAHDSSPSSAAEILRRLREEPHTAPQLARALSISGPAVRKHLAKLLDDGMIEEAGIQQGRGRPATTYVLTEAAEATFRPHRAQILESVLAALHGGTERGPTEPVLRDAGARLARGMLDAREEEGGPVAKEDAVETAMALLDELGGRDGVRQSDSGAEIIRFLCPLAEYSCEYPGACHLVAGFVEEILGVPVEDRCPRSGTPVCVLAFEAAPQTRE